jgi:hypothetical protein
MLHHSKHLPDVDTHTDTRTDAPASSPTDDRRPSGIHPQREPTPTGWPRPTAPAAGIEIR